MPALNESTKYAIDEGDRISSARAVITFRLPQETIVPYSYSPFYRVQKLSVDYTPMSFLCAAASSIFPLAHKSTWRTNGSVRKGYLLMPVSGGMASSTRQLYITVYIPLRAEKTQNRALLWFPDNFPFRFYVLVPCAGTPLICASLRHLLYMRGDAAGKEVYSVGSTNEQTRGAMCTTCPNEFFKVHWTCVWTGEKRELRISKKNHRVKVKLTLTISSTDGAAVKSAL